MQDGRGSNPAISDQVQQGTSAPAIPASTLPPATLTPSTLLVPATPSSSLPPSTIPAPTPHPTAGIIPQNLTNTRGEKSKEGIAEAIENMKTAWEGKYHREGQEDQKEEENDPYETMESRMMRERIEDDQLNREI